MAVKYNALKLGDDMILGHTPEEIMDFITDVLTKTQQYLDQAIEEGANGHVGKSAAELNMARQILKAYYNQYISQQKPIGQ